jgi:hypothetical protein
VGAHVCNKVVGVIEGVGAAVVVATLLVSPPCKTRFIDPSCEEEEEVTGLASFRCCDRFSVLDFADNAVVVVVVAAATLRMPNDNMVQTTTAAAAATVAATRRRRPLG